MQPHPRLYTAEFSTKQKSNHCGSQKALGVEPNPLSSPEGPPKTCGFTLLTCLCPLCPIKGPTFGPWNLPCFLLPVEPHINFSFKTQRLHPQNGYGPLVQCSLCTPHFPTLSLLHECKFQGTRVTVLPQTHTMFSPCSQ